MRVVLFLLDVLFFFLVGAALLRAWMNHLRVPMQVQPGRFVMAISDWLVQPLRRLLPTALAKGRIDAGSLLAALLLALLHALIVVLVLTGGSADGVGGASMAVAVVMLALKQLLRTVLQGLLILLIGYAILSWVQPHSPVMGFLDRLCAPLLCPLRRVVPLVGGVDLSALVLIIALQVGLMLLG